MFFRLQTPQHWGAAALLLGGDSVVLSQVAQEAFLLRWDIADQGGPPLGEVLLNLAAAVRAYRISSPLG